MLDWAVEFLSTEGFVPHGFCLTWRPSVFWTHAISDAIIAISYFSIPIAIAYFAKRRPDIQFGWVLRLFGVFIISCGATHAISIWVLWVPDYGIEALLKVVTAAVSFPTAIALWLLMPTALALPTRRDMASKNAELLELNRQLTAANAEQAAAANALRESEDRYRRLVETQVDMVLCLDLEGRFTFANETTCRVFGLERDQVLGRSWRDFVHSADHADTGRQIAATLVAPHPRVRVDNRILTRNGERWYAWEGAAVLESEQLTVVQAVGRDITEMRRVNTELQTAKEQAEAANFAKSAFLAMMSHEIRTPLTGIMGMVDLMLDEELTARQKDYIQTLKSSTRLLITILNDVLDFSKIERGMVVIENEVFDIRAELNKSIDLYSAAAKTNSTQVVLNIDPAVPDYVRGDSTRLRQVLHNLVGNAVKFTENGTVTVAVSLESGSGGRIVPRFEIADTGIGMTTEQRRNLFLPFSQAHGSISRRYGGTGLGLAISRKLVELMGGAIGVDSALGRGSTFWFTVRLGRTNKPSVTLPKAAVDGARKLSILVAEDNVINQKLIQTMLIRRGHKVDIAENGQVAINSLAAAPYDLVLMDIQMPVLDGVEACRIIRASQPPINRVPIIALTADALQEHREAYEKVGMNGFVSKPIEWDELIATINSVMGGIVMDRASDGSSYP